MKIAEVEGVALQGDSKFGSAVTRRCSEPPLFEVRASLAARVRARRRARSAGRAVAPSAIARWHVWMEPNFLTGRPKLSGEHSCAIRKRFSDCFEML